MSAKYVLANTDKDTKLELPLIEGTRGLPAVDVRGLNKQEGIFTYDPAFTATCSCDSAITFIDGENGRLMYRGYSIEEMAEKSNFLEISYLLLNGELPDRQAMDDFTANINKHRELDETILKTFDGFSADAHPMAMLTSLVGALAGQYHNEMDIQDPEERKLFTHRIIAKMPTIVAAAYRHNEGLPKLAPRADLDYASNFLYMMFGEADKEYKVDPVAARALDVLFMLHADHEQNASTSTVRVAGSTGTDPYAAMAAGITALWGPAHGGANEAVLNMLSEIGDTSNISQYLEKAKDKADPFKLMGFGHRVYKNFDPRAKVIRGYCHQVLEHYNSGDSKLFDLALELEKIALEDEYFVERQLYPNVDFYSGIIYQALGIPMKMFTPLFALARTVGWAAHWCEMLNDPGMRIFRPRQIYTGYDLRNYTDIENR